jgi:hypothetical protein
VNLQNTKLLARVFELVSARVLVENFSSTPAAVQDNRAVIMLIVALNFAFMLYRCVHIVDSVVAQEGRYSEHYRWVPLHCCCATANKFITTTVLDQVRDLSGHSSHHALQSLTPFSAGVRVGVSQWHHLALAMMYYDHAGFLSGRHEDDIPSFVCRSSSLAFLCGQRSWQVMHLGKSQ